MSAEAEPHLSEPQFPPLERIASALDVGVRDVWMYVKGLAQSRFPLTNYYSYFFG